MIYDDIKIIFIIFLKKRMIKTNKQTNRNKIEMDRFINININNNG